MKTKRHRNEFAYLILSHGRLDQPVRLMRTIRLGSPASAILIHHDAKSDPPDQALLQNLHADLVTPRISASWGDFSLVSAMWSGISYALNNIDFDWLIILSGQDYPLRPLAESEAELRSSPYDAFVRASPVSDGPYEFRYYMRYWNLPRLRHMHLVPDMIGSRLAWRLKSLSIQFRLFRIQAPPNNSPTKIGFRTFSHPFSNTFVCHKGSQWITLSRRAATRLIEFGSERSDVVKHYRRTLIPDESYFQTVLWNDHDLRICNDHRRFILWDPERLAHPVTLTMQHFDALTRSGKDFGRKFDISTDVRVLDALDRVVLGSQSPASGAENE